MKQYGYVRISTKKQNIDRQIRNIKNQYPNAIIVQDEYTGTSFARPSWDKLMNKVKAGDMIIFDSVSRMSRDAVEGFAVYESLFNRGIELVFLKEPLINTQTYKQAMQNAVPMTGTAVDYILEGVNRYLLELAKEQIRLAFEQAQKEVDDLRQRTKEGIETARLDGKQIGGIEGVKLTTKKSIAAKEVIRIHAKCFGGSLSDTECIKLAGISRNSYYKYKHDLIAEGVVLCEKSLNTKKP